MGVKIPYDEQGTISIAADNAWRTLTATNYSEKLELFEKTFNLQVEFNGSHVVSIIFNSDSDATWFLLKWA